ncbi:putative RDD family membrane protein YckC [Neolewinella xylanilytica]|uniref:Putative RDD family membrane protein YckC n=1 Tax=Neolewinella xylanilytica TaxID=1514080 RepID=A0A2S6I6U5_9BACT|nr:RDD family protein [Neolewinella xylanilytica]PPK87200.1 putative RDD family membrane protein YckC [Neolewinella xylanilytica]
MPSVTIHTTQNVRIDYETAGVGLRIGAFAIDLIGVLITYFLLLFFLQLVEAEIDLAVLVQYGLVFYILLYFFFTEMLSRGQTIGKRILKLRVIRLDGEDPTPADFLARSIFLLLDVLFTAGVLAVLLIVTGRQNQRLGDVIARTVVIHTRHFGGVSLRDILTIRNREEHVARFASVQRMNDNDMLLVKQTLARYRHYGNPAHRAALRELAAKMSDLLEVAQTDRPASDEQFLEALLLDYIVLTR